MRLIMGDATARPGAVRTVAALLVLSLSPTGAVLLTRNRLARSRAPGPSALSGWQPLPLASTSFFSLPVHDAGDLLSVVLPKIDSDKGKDSAAATAVPLDTAHGGFLVDTVYSVFLAKNFLSSFFFQSVPIDDPTSPEYDEDVQRASRAPREPEPHPRRFDFYPWWTACRLPVIWVLFIILCELKEMAARAVRSRFESPHASYNTYHLAPAAV